MEHISIQLEASVARQVDAAMREFHYSTKTEFIRECIRDKLKQLAAERERKKAFQALLAARGIFKGRGKAKTDEEFRKLREEAGQEFMGMLEKRFSQK